MTSSAYLTSWTSPPTLCTQDSVCLQAQVVHPNPKDVLERFHDVLFPLQKLDNASLPMPFRFWQECSLKKIRIFFFFLRILFIVWCSRLVGLGHWSGSTPSFWGWESGSQTGIKYSVHVIKNGGNKPLSMYLCIFVESYRRFSPHYLLPHSLSCTFWPLTSFTINQSIKHNVFWPFISCCWKVPNFSFFPAEASISTCCLQGGFYFTL